MIVQRLGAWAERVSDCGVGLELGTPKPRFRPADVFHRLDTTGSRDIFTSTKTVGSRGLEDAVRTVLLTARFDCSRREVVGLRRQKACLRMLILYLT